MPDKVSDALHAIRRLPKPQQTEVVGEILSEIPPTEIVEILNKHLLTRDVDQLNTLLLVQKGHVC
jgi:hypothetical protein